MLMTQQQLYQRRRTHDDTSPSHAEAFAMVFNVWLDLLTQFSLR